MRAYHLAAPLILLYWQLGPLPERTLDSTGVPRWTLSAMAGSGQWEDAQFDCNGRFISSQAVPYQDLGTRLDVRDDTRQLRATFAAATDAGSDYQAAGTSYGAQVAWEGPGAGLGFGLSRRPMGTSPSLYLRLGHETQSHFRVDIRPLTETPGLAGVVRVGVGFPAGFAGLVANQYQAGGFLDLGIPLSKNLDVRLAGTVAPGHEIHGWGAAAGLRYHP